MLLIADGLQIPVIPFGEVVLKLGTELPEQIFSGVTLKLGVVALFTITFTVSEIWVPQLFVAVNVIVTVVSALAVEGVKVVESEFGFEKVPLGADQITDC